MPSNLIPLSEKSWQIWIRQLRLHQWVKNLLLFVPLMAAHKASELNLLVIGLLAFLLFSICASSVYLLNDLLDLNYDRQHPSKCLRPLASGMLSITSGIIILLVLLFTAVAGSVWMMPWKFTLVLISYYVLTLIYSLVLKRIIAIDVIILAILYTVRIIAWTFAFDINLTFWMLAFSIFLFLSLALVKRYVELHELHGETECITMRGYCSSDTEMISSLGAASGYLAVMILALYTQDPATLVLYRHPQIIWLACPLLLYWITRVWIITHRGQMHADPVVFAIRDPSSIIISIMFASIFYFAT